MSQTRLSLMNDLFYRWCGESIISINKLPASGSPREYYRISGTSSVAIGAYNADREENEAFISFSRHFHKKGLAVPEIYLVDHAQNSYLQEDLGDTTLLDYMFQIRDNGHFPEPLTEVYKQVLSDLQDFQIGASADLDYSVCYPRASFDRQSMQWDLSYFKYYFLKLAGIPFNEQRLEDDYNSLVEYLLAQERDYFLYRDFQSRNIMLRDGKPCFIDYQGGRKGALQYDVASLLYDSKADIPPELRAELLQHYIEGLARYPEVDVTAFREAYYPYVLIRIMQAMGAYGFRGFYEKKTHFLQSIPYAMNDLRWILNNVEFSIQIPSLLGVYEKLLEAPKLKRFKDKSGRKSTLMVNINSFSYKHGIPDDAHGHGGGYVFDCRVITNPGRLDEYRNLTGKDKEVQDFLDQKNDVGEFLNNVNSLVDMSVDKYESRKYTHLMVSFGCTGGQHRSVYCAERLAAHLRESQSVQITLWHRELD
ncbi:MAG: phosphotransferase enzyme family protein [Bacteroidetes bacterium]|nr:MAG: phosphotransferase enzyme family protein [Bacteroidota bacterium]